VFQETLRTVLMGAVWFDQEYQCSFLDNGTQIFPRELVEAALTDDVEPLDITPWDWNR
jgi:hypothetical protein